MRVHDVCMCEGERAYGQPFVDIVTFFSPRLLILVSFPEKACNPTKKKVCMPVGHPVTFVLRLVVVFYVFFVSGVVADG